MTKLGFSLLSNEERNIVIEIASKRGFEFKTWNDVRLECNRVLGRDNDTARTYQRIYQDYLLVDGAYDIKEDIMKEKFKLQDVKREYISAIRNESRVEVLVEHLQGAIRALPAVHIEPYTIRLHGASCVATPADWHLGANHDNFMSKYSVDIATKRIGEYADAIIRECKSKVAKELLVINMGDMIEGNIHLGTRLEAELHAVDQTILAGELFANFLMKLRENLDIPIKVGWVLDNHSRIHANKKDHMEDESFGKIIMELTRLRLRETDIEFIGHTLDTNIGHIYFGGRNIVWVHGHLDNPDNVVSKLNNMLEFKIDELFIAHRHHFKTWQGLTQVGSMKGTDTYAKDKRLYSKPSQSIVVYEGRNRHMTEVIW